MSDSNSPAPPVLSTPASSMVLRLLVISCAAVYAGFAFRVAFYPPEPHPPTLPVLAKISEDLEAVERSGKTERLSSLRGKVFTCAYLYTVCPHGCSAVMNQMRRLQKNFGTRPDFHQVSIAIDPEHNTPPILAAYAGGIGIYPNDPWWLLTGDAKKMSAFMEGQLQLEPAKPIPVAERLNPLDTNKYDLRITLVDRKGRVRGRYDVFHPLAEVSQKMREQLQADTEFLLNNPTR